MRMPRPFWELIEPLLTMPPEKFVTELTLTAVPAPETVPLLVMPPVNVEIFAISKPSTVPPFAEIVPLL
jgi:hypothetical protein